MSNISFLKRLLDFAETALPEMSQTELDALETGDVWFDRELASGRPNFSMLKSLTLNVLTDEERAFIDGPVRTLCTMTSEWDVMTHGKDLPPEVWQFMKREKFFGILVSKEHGGLGFSHAAFSIISKMLISRAFTIGSTVLISNSFGAVKLLSTYGTNEQRAYYLPRLVSGEEIWSFAMTNPYAGSDLMSMPDVGHVEYGMFRGERVLGIRVSWEKRYITLAPVATVLELAFQTMRDGKPLGITCALIPTDLPGIAIGDRHWPARQSFMNGPTSGTDVFIPMHMVIGGEAMLGKGWRMAMEQLHAARVFAIPPLATAGTQFVARNVGAYARLREQFRRPIGIFEGVQTRLARIAADAYILESARAVTMAAMDAGYTPAVISALLKYQSTERARSAINDGMDILGGRGIIDGPRNFLFNWYQTVPIVITVDGANILTRSFIVFGQGLMRCHPYLFSLYQHARKRDGRGLAKGLAQYAGHVCGMMLRTMRLTGAALFWKRNSFYAHVELASARFALLSDFVLLSCGKSLKRRERISGGMADVLSEMYLVSCVLASSDLKNKDVHALVSWIHARSMRTIALQIDDILNSMPGMVLPILARILVLPFGVRWSDPTTAQDKVVAGMLLIDGPMRDLITQGIFVSKDPHDITGCLEVGLTQVTLKESLPEHLLRRIIDVDAFDSKELSTL